MVNTLVLACSRMDRPSEIRGGARVPGFTGNPKVLPSVANIGNYKATEDWWFILTAILFVDTFLIFLVRFMPQIFGQPINDWYDQFGLAAVLSDVAIIAIGIGITRYLYTGFFMEQEGWDILYFIALAVVIQVVHDLAFAFGVIGKIPKGHNSMIDVFKAYIEGGPKIIFVDALMVAGSIGLAAMLKEQDFHYTVSLGLVTSYALSYILYTNIR